MRFPFQEYKLYKGSQEEVTLERKLIDLENIYILVTSRKVKKAKSHLADFFGYIKNDLKKYIFLNATQRRNEIYIFND